MIKRIGKIVSVVGISMFFMQCNTATQKIGVIQMEELVYDFEGMKEATEEYTNKMNQWEAESDSLKKGLDQLLYDIKLDSINQEGEKSKTDKQNFMLLRQKYYTLQQNTGARAQEEDQKMTLAVMGQLNEYVEVFGEEKGYDIIITNTQLNNVGYVKGSVDITKEVLTYANAKYNGE